MIQFRGANISGAEASNYAEWGSGDWPYWFTDGWFPSMEDAVYLRDVVGMNTIRFPISWNYLTNSANATDPFYGWPEYRDKVHLRVREFLEAGMSVVLDLHNYFRYSPNGGQAGTGNIVSEGDITVAWTLLATLFRDLANVYTGTGGGPELVYGLMNEPKQMSSALLLRLTNAGIAAIRAISATRIAVSGNGWSGMHSWFDKWVDADGIYSNSELFARGNLVDTTNVDIEVHQYFDKNASGTATPSCVYTLPRTVEVVDRFAAWARENQFKAIVGEFGGHGQEAACVPVLDTFLTGLEDNEDVFVGWLVWVASPYGSQNQLLPQDGVENPLIASVYKPHAENTGGPAHPPPVCAAVNPFPEYGFDPTVSLAAGGVDEAAVCAADHHTELPGVSLLRYCNHSGEWRLAECNACLPDANQRGIEVAQAHGKGRGPPAILVLLLAFLVAFVCASLLALASSRPMKTGMPRGGHWTAPGRGHPPGQPLQV